MRLPTGAFLIPGGVFHLQRTYSPSQIFGISGQMAPFRGISVQFAQLGGEPILFPFAQFSLLQRLCHVELICLKVIAYSGGGLLVVRVHT